MTNKQEELQVPRVLAPLDENKYLKSFTLDQSKEYLEFFHEFGFVVVRDVLNQEEIKASIEDVWNYCESGTWHLASKATPTQIDRNSPETWSEGWPPMSQEGILGFPSVFTNVAFTNRQNPNIHQVCSTVLNRKDLWVNIDRYGLFRPTVNVAMGDGTKVNREGWKTMWNIHFDMNPWRYYLPTPKPEGTGFPHSYWKLDSFCVEYNDHGIAMDNELKIQGLINFADNLTEDGGIQIVPGFHKHIAEWVESTRESMGKRFGDKNSFIVLPECWATQGAQRIPMRAGSLLLWDSRMPHGSAPNDSSCPRLCQFIKMFPAQKLNENRCAVVSKRVQESGCKVSELGKKLFGLAPWEQ